MSTQDLDMNGNPMEGEALAAATQAINAILRRKPVTLAKFDSRCEDLMQDPRWLAHRVATQSVDEYAAEEHLNPALLRSILERLGIRENDALYANDPATDPSRTRSLHLFRLYQIFGTCEGVAQVVGITRERVRQILARGEKLGLFVLPRHQDLPPGAARTALKKYGTVRRALEHMRILGSVFERGMERDGITKEERAQYAATLQWRYDAARNYICLRRYRVVAQRLGRNPTSSDLQMLDNDGHSLYAVILRRFGGFQQFLDRYGIHAQRNGPRREDRIRLHGITPAAIAIMHERGLTRFARTDIAILNEIAERSGADWQGTPPGTKRGKVVGILKSNKCFVKERDANGVVWFRLREDYIRELTQAVGRPNARSALSRAARLRYTSPTC